MHNYIKTYNILAVATLSLLCLFSCSENDGIGTEGSASAGDVINIGGIETEEMTVITRAASYDAEKIDWLVQPLTNGLDITYGLSGVPHAQSMEDVAILKLTNINTNPATYSFNFRKNSTSHTTDNDPAIWHNNGFHYFQGVHVPERIRYTSYISEIEGTGKAPGLTLDQHNGNATGDDTDLGNYTLLAHYLGMPANYKLTATVERIKLPFRHRLARVVAFVLIDPELHTTLKGYKKDAAGNSVATEDPNTTSLRFCNVKVLQGVEDVVATGGHHTLTPKWAKPRKVIPHFDGERGSYSYKTQTTLDEDFKMYVGMKDNKTEEIYPTTGTWNSYRTATDHKGYKEINYGKVPVYDIIVRPTYTTWENVMYDEEGYNADSETKLRELASHSNSIDFEIELENGLRYEKTFEFDLNANYQTVVYLRISKEKVDYDDAGSEVWVEEKGTDDWYGVDNENGNTLSMAGSSWQRAYRSTSFPENGSTTTYSPGSTNGVTDGDYYNNTSESVGQYLGSTDKWTELLLQACEGGMHHGDYFILDHDITIDAKSIPADFVFTGHLDAQDHTITLEGTNADTYEPTNNYTLAKTETLYNKVDGNFVAFVMPQLFICEEVAQAKKKKASTRSVPNEIPMAPEMMTEVRPTLAEVMANKVVYYEKVGSDYRIWNPRSWVFYTHRISAGGLFCGLNGIYTTKQELVTNPYAQGFKWEANVHKENKNIWVPTPGYRAEVLNAVVTGGTLFTDGAVITGNVQNCFNKAGVEKTAVTHTPSIPQYK